MPRGVSTLATYDPTGGMWGVDAWANFGKALAAIAANRRAEQDKQEQRDLAQVRYLTAAAQADPELASNPDFYRQVTSRYGKNFPEVGPILETLKNRGQLLDTAKATHVRYLKAQGDLEQAHQALSAQLQETPDTLADGAPNIDKHVLMGQLQQIGDPATFPQRALSQFTPEERSQIALTTKMFGDSMPTSLDPYKQFTPEGKELYAVQTGGIDPNSPVGQAIQSRAGLKLSPVKAIEMAQQKELEQAKIKAASDLEAARAQHASQARAETDAFARGRLRLNDTLTRGRMDYGVDTAERKYDYTHPQSDPGQVSYKDIVAGVAAAGKAWDNQLKASLSKVPQGASAAKIRADFVAQYGARPAPITPGDAMVLALRAQQAGAGDPTAAQTAVSHMVSNYQAARAAGKSPADALATAQPGVPPIAQKPLPVPGMSAPQKPAAAPSAYGGGSLLPGVQEGGDLTLAPVAEKAVGMPVTDISGGGTKPGSRPGTPGVAPMNPMLLVATTASQLLSHGEASVRQDLDQHLGIRGPQADDLIQRATALANKRRLAVQQQSIGAATGTEPETPEEDQTEPDEEQ
jgi:hypothetical protein